MAMTEYQGGRPVHYWTAPDSVSFPAWLRPYPNMFKVIELAGSQLVTAELCPSATALTDARL